MCGPSSAQESLAGQEQTFASILQSNFNARFADQTQTLQELNQSLSPIVAGGINQQGFSPQELAALNTQAINATGAANRNALQAAALTPAFRSDTGLESGVAAPIRGGIAATEAGNLANQELGITEKNYDVGRQNYLGAVGALQALSNAYAPNAGAVTGQLGQAFGSATEVQNMKNQEAASIVGGITGLASNLIPGIGGAFKALSGGGGGGASVTSPTGGLFNPDILAGASGEAGVY